jgi:hypothetical protein
MNFQELGRKSMLGASTTFTGKRKEKYNFEEI